MFYYIITWTVINISYRALTCRSSLQYFGECKSLPLRWRFPGECIDPPPRSFCRFSLSPARNIAAGHLRVAALRRIMLGRTRLQLATRYFEQTINDVYANIYVCKCSFKRNCGGYYEAIYTHAHPLAVPTKSWHIYSDTQTIHDTKATLFSLFITYYAPQ